MQLIITRASQAYMYPIDDAALVAVGAVRSFLETAKGQAIERVIFALFSQSDVEVGLI